MKTQGCNHIGHAFARTGLPGGLEAHACEGCGEVYRTLSTVSLKEAASTVLGFGWHRGVALLHCPLSYLAWLSETADSMHLRSCAFVVLEHFLQD